MSNAPQAPTATNLAADNDDLVELLRRTAARDAAAFAALYRQTHALLYGVVARILTRGDASGEALQEAYVRIWEKAGDFDSAKGSPIAWMATIARNRALDEVRRVRPTSLEDMPEGFEPAAETVDPLAARARSEQPVGAARLPRRARSRNGAKWCCSPITAASAARRWRRRFDRPVPTIKTWLRRGLMQLRECLES